MKANMNMDGRDHVEDEAVLCCSVKEDSGFKEANRVRIVLLEIKPDLRMITRKLPLIVDVKETNATRFPGLTESFQNYIDITGGTIVPFCDDCTDISSDTLHIFYVMGTLSNSTAEVINSGYMFKTSRSSGRTHHRVINLGEFLDKCSSVTESGNLLVSPLARWILNSIEASARRSLINREVFCKPLMSDERSTSSSTRNVETSQLLTSLTRTYILLSGRPKSPVTRKMDSDAKISGELLLSCSNMKSTSSDCSTSSSGCFMTSATIRCFWKNNVRYFFFSDNAHVYMASSIKVRSSAHKGLDYIYLFHSWTGSRKDSKNKADIIGKMKVSSSLLLNPDRSKSMESEFVLFATNDELTRESQKSSKAIKTNEMSKIIPGRLSHNSSQLCDESASPIEDVWQAVATDIRVSGNIGQIDCLSDDFLPSHELVAIVIKEHGYDRMNGSISGGWGLKFLEQVKVDSSNSSQSEGCPVQDCRQIYTGKKCSSSKTVEVVIPIGFHGGPTCRTGGPSSLVERWMSNGHCDCGGWDIGCPLKVLINDCNSSNSSPKSVPEDNDKSLRLVVQGTKQVEPTFKLLNLTKDMYAVYFQPTLSALQSFSVAVAIIHSHAQDLYLKL